MTYNKYNDNHSNCCYAMKAKIIITVTIVFSFFALASCKRNVSELSETGVAITRCLEEAIGIGEKVISERDLIDSVSLTEGTEAAIRLEDSLQFLKGIEDFWAKIEEADLLTKKVTDSHEQQAIIDHIMPYVDKINILIDDILGATLDD